MSENEIRVLYVQPGKYPEERTISNTLRALQELVGGDIECCRPWRDSVCVICNDSGKIDGLPPNRLYGHTDFLAGSFVVCGNGGEDFISLTDRQVFLYERLYHVLYIMLRVPYTTIYLLDFFSSLSRSYEEAAYIDGCSHSRTFWQIMLPLVQPAIITVTIFNFMSVWNEFFMALIFTTSDSMTPVGVGLLQIVNAMKYSGQYGAMFAAVIIVFLPTFLLYLFLSEKIIVGATSGGVKG